VVRIKTDALGKIKRAHPSKNIVASEGKEIFGKKIVLCITGSVAAYKAIELSRMLMRHGADVHAVMSKSAHMATSPEIMNWATGNDVVTKLTGNLEHVVLADVNTSDLVLVYPCTANTIGKMANGIDDTTVASVLSVALGTTLPILVAPAMHGPMYTNQIIKQNIERLKGIGVKFLGPSLTEGKAKIIEPELVLQSVVRELTKNRGSLSLEGRNILVTTGSTAEHIDPIRVITNLSSGKMGNAIADEAERAGGNVTLVCGHQSEHRSEFSKTSEVIRAYTNREMERAVLSQVSSKSYDVAIFCAAITDFEPQEISHRKIDTKSGKLVLPLLPAAKVVDQIKLASRNKKLFLVAFKAEHNVSDASLIEKAFRKLQECSGDLIVANDLGRKGCAAGSDQTEVFLIDKQRKVIHLPLQDKRIVARKILYTIMKLLAAKKISSKK
jgi:phosphopantothenoylcysteine decarboxylase/phosphopantothenate--cysteine ligase